MLILKFKFPGPGLKHLDLIVKEELF